MLPWKTQIHNTYNFKNTTKIITPLTFKLAGRFGKHVSTFKTHNQYSINIKQKHKNKQNKNELKEEKILSISYQHYPCEKDWSYTSNSRCRGITTWNTNNNYIISPIAPGDSRTLSFTCTVPRCYSSANTQDGQQVQGRDCCLIVFNAWAKDNNTPNGPELKYTLNDRDAGGCHISGVAAHGGTQAFDIGPPYLHDIYNDMGPNTFIITNTSASTVQVDHFKIYRAYKMCNLRADEGGYCTITAVPKPGSFDCMAGIPTGIPGNLDSTRIDKPCHYNFGGGLSFSQCHSSVYKDSTIPAGGSFSWIFNFNSTPGGFPGNYTGESMPIQLQPNTSSNNLKQCRR
jgi:hypothetical protein